MEEIELRLRDDEFASLKGLKVAVAAVEICKIHFRRQNSDVTFPPSPNNADLHVKFPGDSGFDIEVKGTEKLDIAWNQFKVSGTPSYEMLRNGMPLYRVSGIRSDKVKIFILKYCEDFEMTPEPRWRIHPRK